MVSIVIKLLNNNGKKWCQFGNSYVKGFAFIDNRLLSEEEIFYEMTMSISSNKLLDKIKYLNGNFSAIIQYEGKLYLFADKLKTYPLLYSKIGDKFYVTDQALVILDNLTDYKPDNISIASYLAAGYLHGNKTFLENCFIVSAGTYIVFDGLRIKKHEYHQHIYIKKNLSDKEIMDGCVKSMENSIKRMVVSIGDRPIWIPLSGGYDSRLIACVLKKMNIPNVKCFTYGIPDSFEIKISEQVAKKLGFPWYYIEFNDEKIKSLINNPLFYKYTLWGMNLNTTSHYQDIIAIKELKHKRIIEDNAVIVPGHSGEILGRDQIPYHLLDSDLSVAELIYYRYFQLNIIKNNFRKSVVSELGEQLNKTITNEDKGLAIDLFTNWNIQNRQANFIVNSVRVYEFFGYEWRLPLWDDELSYFWFSLDYLKNSKVKLYNKFMFEKYFGPFDVAYYKNKSIGASVIGSVRLPFGIKEKVKKYLSKFPIIKSKYDPNGFNIMSDCLKVLLNGYKHETLATIKDKTNSYYSLFHIFLTQDKLKKL